MNSRQRAYLGSLANNIDPIFQIGKASLTPEIIEALDAALEKRELIKVSVLKNCIDDPKEIASVWQSVHIPCRKSNRKENDLLPQGKEESKD